MKPQTTTAQPLPAWRQHGLLYVLKHMLILIAKILTALWPFSGAVRNRKDKYVDYFGFGFLKWPWY
ncbi:MAG: hypothetical protein KZQ92_06145 [Candidatus Thiodiazotropha sp. (ex Lucinoma borealis)]|nr:hypothetical protein [Candidatus Thiodiazotropha sp. (ex Lucinoma borealis)]